MSVVWTALLGIHSLSQRSTASITRQAPRKEYSRPQLGARCIPGDYKDIAMCDYSAEGVKNRKARVGDKLMASMLTEHTLGLVSPDQPDEAVCLDCGTRLIISNIPPNRQNDWRVGPTAPATFQQEDIELSGYRDGVVFRPSARCPGAVPGVRSRHGGQCRIDSRRTEQHDVGGDRHPEGRRVGP